MRDLTEKALETCSKEGASYADIRIVTIHDEDISIKRGNIQTLNITNIKGFGIRTIANGGLGFAGSYLVTPEEIERVAKLAVRIGKASGATRKEPIKFVDVKAVEDSYKTPFKKDPFSVPTEEKIEILVEVDKRLREFNPEVIKMTQSDLAGSEMTKSMLSHIETGHSNPSMKNLEYIAKKLDMPMAYLLEDDGTEYRKQQEEQMPMEIILSDLNAIDELIKGKTYELAEEELKKLLDFYTFNEKSKIYADVISRLGFCKLKLQGLKFLV